jgi:hypothetical protein
MPYRAPIPEIPTIPTRIALTLIGAGRRKRRVSAAAGLLVSTLALGAYGLGRHLTDTRAAEREAAFGELSACLLGGPLKSGETAAERVASLQSSVAGQPLRERPRRDGLLWPAWCSGPAASLAGSADSPELIAAARELERSLREDSRGLADHSRALAPVWQAFAPLPGAEAAPNGRRDLRAPSARAPRFTRAEFEQLDRVALAGLEQVKIADSGNGKVLFVLADEHESAEGPRLYAAASAGNELRTLAVSTAASATGARLELIGTTHERRSPVVFTREQGVQRGYSSEGVAPLLAKDVLGATLSATGSLLVLGRTADGTLELLRSQPGSTLSRQRLASPTAHEPRPSAALLGDWVILHANTGSGAALFARRLGAPPQAAVRLGEVNARPGLTAQRPTLVNCTGTGLAVRASSRGTAHLSFFDGARWTAPLPAPLATGACVGTEDGATLTDLTTRFEDERREVTLAVARCSREVCSPVERFALESTLAGLPELLPDDRDQVSGTSVGAQALLVWVAGKRGGVRMRLGAPSRVGSGTDQVLVPANWGSSSADSAASAGDADVLGVRAVTAGPWALLMLSTRTGLVLLRVDGTGSVTPLRRR